MTRDLAGDTSDVAPAVNLLGDVSYVPVRQGNYEANRLPKNMSQEGLLAVLRDRLGFSEIPIQAPWARLLPVPERRSRDLSLEI